LIVPASANALSSGLIFFVLADGNEFRKRESKYPYSPIAY
jgi:hypothetical protein